MVYRASTAADQHSLRSFARANRWRTPRSTFYIARDGRIAAVCLLSPSNSKRHSARSHAPSVPNASDDAKGVERLVQQLDRSVLRDEAAGVTLARFGQSRRPSTPAYSACLSQRRFGSCTQHEWILAAWRAATKFKKARRSQRIEMIKGAR